LIIKFDFSNDFKEYYMNIYYWFAKILSRSPFHVFLQSSVLVNSLKAPIGFAGKHGTGM